MNANKNTIYQNCERQLKQCLEGIFGLIAYAKKKKRSQVNKPKLT